MNALARVSGFLRRVTFHDKPLPEPEAVNAQPRPMTGFFATLSADQKKRALNYQGPENHGDPGFLRQKKTAPA
jgi:hypothetical protein